MSITLIWAQDASGIIGKDNTLPWHLPDDLTFFRLNTIGKTLLMGRKTWESLPKSVLKTRTALVMTRDRYFVPEGATAVYSIEEVLLESKFSGELMVIGGAEIYRLMLPYADKLIVTRIDHHFEGDTDFPEVNWSEWRELFNIKGVVNQKNAYKHRFLAYDRIQGDD